MVCPTASILHSCWHICTQRLNNWGLGPSVNVLIGTLIRYLRIGSSLIFTQEACCLRSTTVTVFSVSPHRVAVRHVKVKPRSAALTMLKRLDKIRFRGPRTRDEFPDLGESPPASDGECNEDAQPKPRSAAARDTEEVLRDPVSAERPYVSSGPRENPVSVR